MTYAHDRAHPAIGELLVGGDFAIAQGDLGTLAHNAELLALCVAEPLRRELLEVVECCHHRIEDASERWCEVSERLRSELRTIDPALHPSA